jgi:hypothetical protein
VGVCLATLALAAGIASATGRLALVDQGWRLLDEDGKRTVELNTVVVNECESPRDYAVDFVLECNERRPWATPASSSEPTGDPAGQPWAAVTIISVMGGPLAPGASTAVTARLPYEMLATGKLYRFRAELPAYLSGLLQTAPSIAGQASPLLSGAQFAALTTVSQSFSSEHSAREVSGAGVMSGEHEAHRTAGEWVESGSGTIDATTRQGRLVLEYTYSSHGTSAATLVASATATGQLIQSDGEVVPVRITSASAQITFSGSRQEVGPIVRRSGATATGTFTGTVGGEIWTGLLTMRNGTHTLDPTTGIGQHSFDIQFTAS